jgi:predicted transposase/invertase (TIGR01784 family)
MPKSKRIHNPHDKVFRSMMEYQEFSSAFFQYHLPEKLANKLDYSSLKLLKETHLDKSLQKTINDLLFSCKLNSKDAYLSLLVEHQSSADKFIAFRIYHYLFSLLNSHLKQHPEQPLPPVYVLLFYHGEITPYPYSLNLLDSFDDPLGLMQEVLFQPVPIVDVNRIPDEALQTQEWVGALSMTMKHIRQAELTPYALRILRHLPEVSTARAREMLNQLLVYLLTEGNIDDVDEFIDASQEIPGPVRSELMTFAEKIEARGEARGQASEKVAIAKNLLNEGVAPAFIAQVTGLSLAEIEQLRQ